MRQILIISSLILTISQLNLIRTLRLWLNNFIWLYAVPLKVRESKINQPIDIKCRLGWTVFAESSDDSGVFQVLLFPLLWAITFTLIIIFLCPFFCFYTGDVLNLVYMDPRFFINRFFKIEKINTGPLHFFACHVHLGKEIS